MSEMKPRAKAPGVDDYNSAEDDTVGSTLSAIETMRESGSYDWADDTLRGIYDSVAERQRVTWGQRKALQNILRSRPKAMEELGLDYAFE
jgi:hypothetical protein